MVARTRRSVTLHAHCWSCLIKPYVRNMFRENSWLRRKISLVFTAVCIQVMLCRFMTMCNSISVYEFFWETRFCHLQSGSENITNVSVYVGNCKRCTDCGKKTFHFDLPCALFANSDLRLETKYSSKTSGFTDKTARRHNQENYNLNYGYYLSQRFLLHTVTLARNLSFIESFKISWPNSLQNFYQHESHYPIFSRHRLLCVICNIYNILHQEFMGKIKYDL